MKELIQDLMSKSNAPEVILDLLLVYADKPSNYEGLKNRRFTEEHLWDSARNFVQSRHPPADVNELTLKNARELIKKAFIDAEIKDILTFKGMQLPEGENRNGSEGEEYYVREQYFQKQLFSVCEDAITNSIVLRDPSEKEILAVYIRRILPDIKNRKVELDIDTFREEYQSVLGKEMPLNVDINRLQDLLIRMRLAYEYDGSIWLFWYSMDTDFLNKLDDRTTHGK